MLDHHISLSMDAISINGVENIPPDLNSPIFTISVLGPMRKGKSWLLNYFVSCQDFFPVGARRACTNGMRIEFVKSSTPEDDMRTQNSNYVLNQKQPVNNTNGVTQSITINDTTHSFTNEQFMHAFGRNFNPESTNFLNMSSQNVSHSTPLQYASSLEIPNGAVQQILSQISLSASKWPLNIGSPVSNHNLANPSISSHSFGNQMYPTSSMNHANNSNHCGTRKNAVAVIDVEGMGDIHVNRDRDIALLCLLLSGVTIYNVQGYAPKEEILRSLDISLKSFELISNNEPEFGKKAVKITFGCLNVVIRDYQHHLTKEEIEQELFSMEIVPDGPPSIREPIEERNRIRQRLKKYYSGLYVWLLPFPTQHTSQLTVEESIPFSSLSQGFRQAFEHMRVSIQEQLVRVSGNPFKLKSANEMKSFIQKVITMLSNENLKVSSLVSILEERDAEHYMNSIIDSARKQIDNLVIPCNNLEDQFQKLKSQAKLRLQYLIGTLTKDNKIHDENSQSLKRYMTLLEKRLDNIVNQKRLENNFVLAQRVSEVINTLLTDALQMMNPEFPITYHDNFDDITHKVEDKLMENDIYMALPLDTQKETKGNLHRHLSLLRSVHETQMKAKARTDLTSIQKVILKNQVTLQSELPMNHHSLNQALNRIAEEVRQLAQGSVLNVSESEISKAIQEMWDNITSLNQYIVDVEINKSVSNFESDARRMLDQYEMQQIIQSTFQVQLECFLDDKFQNPPRILNLLPQEERENVIQKLKSTCQNVYNQEVQKMKGLNTDCYLTLKNIYNSRTNIFEEETSSFQLPMPKSSLLSQIHEKFRSVAEDLQDEALVALKTKVKAFNTLEEVLTKDQLDTYHNDLKSFFLKKETELLQKNESISLQIAENYFSSKFKDEITGVCSTLQELVFTKELEEDFRHIFWSYEHNSYKLSSLPLNDYEGSFNERIHNAIVNSLENLKKDQELQKLRSMAANNSTDMININRMLVEKVRGLRLAMDELKRENEELKSKLDAQSANNSYGKNSTHAERNSNTENCLPEPQSSKQDLQHQSNESYNTISCSSCNTKLSEKEMKFISQNPKDEYTLCQSCFFKKERNDNFTLNFEYQRIKNINLIMKRLEEMGFTSSQYFSSQIDIIHAVLRHKGELKTLVEELLQKGSQARPQKSYNYELELLDKMGFTNSELNRRLLERYDGSVQKVAEYLRR